MTTAKRVAAATLAALLLASSIGVAAASAGKATPLTVAQGKRQAKQFVHDACQSRPGNCTGSRVKDCASVTKFRVDCIGYILFPAQYCNFKVSVVATGDNTVRVSGRNPRCHDYAN
jgi:hypothetical protein